MNMYYNNYGYNFMGPLIGIFIVFGWIIFVIFIIMFLRHIGISHRSGKHLHDMFGTGIEDPKSILKTRLARGEITKEEYLEISKILEK